MSSVKQFDRTPEQWRAAVELIEDETVRARCACIVWWDYFGGQPVRHRWSHLDIYLKRPFVPMKNAVIEAGLDHRGLHPGAGANPSRQILRLRGRGIPHPEKDLRPAQEFI